MAIMEPFSKSWPDSKNVASTAYNPESQVLTVEYRSSRIYRYKKVPLSTWKQLLGTDSIGRFLNTDVVTRYEFTEVTEKEK